MRTVIICLLLFLCVKTSQAQPYQSLFGKTSTSWTFRWFNIGAENDSAYVQKDTIINGLSYKKVVTDYITGGYFREDTTVGKVWFRNGNPNHYNSGPDTAERLVYDFSLQPGDTFDISNKAFPAKIDSLDIVDSVITINGLRHIFFRAKYYGETYQFIEGISSISGVMCNAYVSMYIHEYLLCTYKEGVKTSFENLGYKGNCNPPTSVTKVEKNTVSLSPNPAYDELIITNNTPCQVIQAQLYDATGRKLNDVQGANIRSVNLTSFPGGYYIFHMVLSDHSVIINPLIIQK